MTGQPQPLHRMTTAAPDFRDPGRQFLHSPGPSHVPLEVMQAMGRQPMDMADPRLGQTIAAI